MVFRLISNRQDAVLSADAAICAEMELDLKPSARYFHPGFSIYDRANCISEIADRPKSGAWRVLVVRLRTFEKPAVL